MDTILFVAAFIKNWKKIGSLVPSSRFLAKKMINPIDFKRAGIIVELGAGTGVVTREILKKMKKDAKLFVFETNPAFCRRLRTIKDSRLAVVADSAVNLGSYLKEKADYILSGIPVANLSAGDTTVLLASIENSLHKNGLYIQFQYLPRSYKQIKSVFKPVKVGFTLFNIPPAFVYECVKK